MSYQPFLLLVASVKSAFVAYNSGKAINHASLDAGVHVFSNSSFCDATTKKVSHARELFLATLEPLKQRLASARRKDERVEADARASSVKLLQRILSNHDPAVESRELKDSICVHGEDYGTVSSSIVFLAEAERRFYFYHASTAPCRGEYQLVEAPARL